MDQIDLSQYSLTSPTSSNPLKSPSPSAPLLSDLVQETSPLLVSSNPDMGRGFTLDSAKSKMGKMSSDFTDFTNTRTTVGDTETTYGEMMLYGCLIIFVIIVVGLCVWGIATLIKNSTSSSGTNEISYDNNATTTTCTENVCTVTKCTNGSCTSIIGGDAASMGPGNSSSNSNSTNTTNSTNSNSNSNSTNTSNVTSNTTAGSSNSTVNGVNQTKETFNNMMYNSRDNRNRKIR